MLSPNTASFKLNDMRGNWQIIQRHKKIVRKQHSETLKLHAIDQIKSNKH